MLESGKRYYEFVREERLFCAALAHLLMQKGPNLATFLQLVDGKLPADSRLPTASLEEAEIYVEFAFLRDYWNGLESDNVAKRRLIFDLLSKVDTLRHYNIDSFPPPIPDFNRTFMGARGRRIKNDIVNPGQWSVSALSETFGSEREEFRDFCCFKWAFNIKPDIIVLLPGSKPICVEAKLDSREGQYPASNRETVIFDRLFGEGEGRVHQLDLQQFMFRTLLDAPCQSVFIARASTSAPNSIFLSWQEVFEELDVGSSIGFVGRLIKENRYLKPAPSARRRTAWPNTNTS